MFLTFGVIFFILALEAKTVAVVNCKTSFIKNLIGKIVYLCIWSLSLNISGYVTGELFFGSIILGSG